MTRTKEMILLLILRFGIVFLFAGSTAASAKQLVYTEYFFDTDPGQGNGMSILPCDGKFSDSLEQFCFNVQGLSLKDGKHTLFLRLKDDQSHWGMRRLDFYSVSSSPYVNKTITAAEYKIDETGPWTNLQAADGSFDEATEQLIADVIDTSLSLGQHMLYVRVRDSYQVWGTPRQCPFAVTASNPYKKLTGAEYFIDTDPGQGKAIALTAKDGSWDSSMEGVLKDSIRTGTLTTGEHRVWVRYRDNCTTYTKFNGWGEPKGAHLHVSDPHAIRGTAYETCAGTPPKPNRIIVLRLDSLGADYRRDTTDSQGHYTFSGLAEQPYYIYVIKDNQSQVLIYHLSELLRDTSGLNVRYPCSVDQPTNVEEILSAILPTDFDLSQNYPNPFNPSTQIVFALPRPSSVTLTIYNMLGQVVRILASGRIAAGTWSVCWDGRSDRGIDVASGIYLYRITAGDFSATRKMVLLR